MGKRTLVNEDGWPVVSGRVQRPVRRASEPYANIVRKIAIATQTEVRIPDRLGAIEQRAKPVVTVIATERIIDFEE